MGSDLARGGREVREGILGESRTAIPRLVSVAGPGAGRAFAMSSVLATVGRHPTNDHGLSNPRVSGVQLKLRRQEDRGHVRDAGSTNGTWLRPNRETDIRLAAVEDLVI